jgi:hypothetical protein
VKCQKNPEHEYIETVGWYLDDDGTEIEYPECANCIEDSRIEYREKIETASDVDAPELIDEYEKIIEKSHINESKEKKPEHSYNVIDKYSEKLHDIIGAPKEACKAIVQWDISVALHRLFFADGKGRVLPNLGFMWIAPSGADKTPIYNWGVMNLQEKLFSKWKYIHYNRVGGKALISSMSKIKSEEISYGRILTLITQDEVSTLAKESNSDGLSDVFEAFAQAYDGQLSSSTTVIRQSEIPKPSYSPMWFQGTPTFLKYVNEDFWDIGLGNRIFFVKYTTSDVRAISKTLHAKEFYEEFISDLEKLNKIEKADFSDDAWELYNDYQMKIMKDVQSVQIDLESSVDTYNFEVTSKVKYPIQIIKMALIISASRFNYDSSLILRVEKKDVEEAIKEVEAYHDNMIYIHSIWETQSAQRLRHESVEILAKKISNHIKRLCTIGKSYRLDWIDQKDDSYSLAVPDNAGLWVKHSDLLKQSHMKASGLRSFEEVITTLIERDELIKKECKIYVTTKLRNGNKNRTLTVATFYKSKNSSDPSLEKHN